MPTTPDYLIEVSTRHQVFLEGNKTRISNTFAPYLVSISKKIEKQLASKDLTEFNKSRLEKLLKSVNDDILDDYQKYYKVWKEQIIDLSEYEAGFEVRTLEQVIDTKEFTLPSKTQLTQAVMNTPLSSVQGIAGTESLKTFYDGWSKKTIDSTTKIIRDGFYIGKTTPQIVREIKGTKGAKFKDGQLARGNKELSILTRTAVQHAAVQSREEVWRNNSDIVKEVEWVSTLDGRTSAICRGLDGQKFPIDSGPRPPAHPACRSTIVASLDSRYSFLDKDATRSARGESGEVSKTDADDKYYEWLKTQGNDFQNEVLGKKRAEIFRDGGLSVSEFKKLSFDEKGFKQRTLEEMKQLEPLVFKKAGV